MSGGSYPTGVSTTTGFGFFAPQSTETVFDHFVVFHAGVGAAVAGAGEVVFAGVVVDVFAAVEEDAA